MLVDIEIDGQKWIDNKVLPEYRGSVRCEYTNGGIRIYHLNTFNDPNLEDEFLAHYFEKDDLPVGLYYADSGFRSIIRDIYIGKPWEYLDYGLCDHPSQVLDCGLYSEYIYSDKKYVALFYPIFREDQPSKDGFRYHKWGYYIGDKEPKHEYLYDDKHIDVLYSFTFVEVE